MGFCSIHVNRAANEAIHSTVAQIFFDRKMYFRETRKKMEFYWFVIRIGISLLGAQFVGFAFIFFFHKMMRTTTGLCLFIDWRPTHIHTHTHTFPHIPFMPFIVAVNERRSYKKIKAFFFLPSFWTVTIVLDARGLSECVFCERCFFVPTGRLLFWLHLCRTQCVTIVCRPEHDCPSNAINKITTECDVRWQTDAPLRNVDQTNQA